ncbi:MAG: hypothetical protein PHE27_04345 [Alphaproteobacteria bacterium]|nr:hypothetical protein [Alphaproteobacteria bacterium]
MMKIQAPRKLTPEELKEEGVFPFFFDAEYGRQLKAAQPVASVQQKKKYFMADDDVDASVRVKPAVTAPDPASAM